MSKYNLGASSDIGCERESQEDFIQFKELDSDNIIAVISDGTGSAKGNLQPAVMVTMSIIQEITDIFNENKELFLNQPNFFIKRAIINANNVLGAFKMGNEELFSGYAASVTVAVLTQNERIYIANAGNTRLYIMRDSKIIQMTRDHTEAQIKYDNGEIDEETYHIHPARLKMTSGIGLTVNPDIYMCSGKLNQNDLVLMTTDGIHYAIKPEYIMSLVFEAQDVVPACNNLIYAAKEVVKYPDNMSSIIISINK